MIFKNYQYNYLFKLFWILTSLFFLIQILFTKIPLFFLSRPYNNFLLAICSYFLIIHYSSPLPKFCTKGNQTKMLIFSLSILIILCFAKSIIGKYIYDIIPVIAIIFTFVFKIFINKRHIIFSISLTIIAIISAFLGKQNVFSNIDWAILQFFLVFFGFLGGWATLKACGIGYLGIGRSIFVTEGVMNGIKAFFYGSFLALPWSLGKILMGSVFNFTWVKHWWNIFSSFDIGVASEAWGRALFVPILFLIFSKFSNTGKVFRAATLIVAYWYSYLYLNDSFFNIFITAPIMVILFAMPIATLMFNKNFETAIGFHFSIEFFKLLAAYLINNEIILVS